MQMHAHPLPAVKHYLRRDAETTSADREELQELRSSLVSQNHTARCPISTNHQTIHATAATRSTLLFFGARIAPHISSLSNTGTACQLFRPVGSSTLAKNTSIQLVYRIWGLDTLAKDEIAMDWRAAARITKCCMRPWPCILLLAAVGALLAPVQAQGRFGRGFVGLKARRGTHSTSARTPSNQPAAALHRCSCS
jgi:hypothetical protein